MVRQIINEEITIEVGKCEENNWRRNNLLKTNHVKDIGDFLQVIFSFMTSSSEKIVNTKLIYNIKK